MSDRNLLWLRYKNGDIDALGEIFRSFFSDLYFYGLKIVPVSDMVKDVIQEMFIRLWDRRESVSEVENVKSYLIIILRRELINTVKGLNLDTFDENDINDPFTLSAEDIIIESEENEEVKARINYEIQKLTSRQREIIFLRFYNNLSFNDISIILQMNVQSVRNLLFRSLEKIRKSIGKASFQNIDIH